MATIATEEEVRTGKRGTMAEALAYFTRHSEDDLHKDWFNLMNFDPTDFRAGRAGNKLVDHFTIAEQFRTKRDGKDTFEAIMEDREKAVKHWRTCKRDPQENEGRRLAEHWFHVSRITTFRPSITKCIVHKYKATAVLDPTAGWGGRMLGCASLNVPYTGIDTNLGLKPCYDGLMKVAGRNNLHMIWKSCLDVDFSAIDYDFVLTSPPYGNKEIYRHMTPWKNAYEFTTQFLSPLIQKCLDHIRREGWVFFNMDDEMYKNLISSGFRECDEKFGLPTEKGSCKEQVYGWKAGSRPVPVPAPVAAPVAAPAPAPSCSGCPSCAVKDAEIAKLRAKIEALKLLI